MDVPTKYTPLNAFPLEYYSHSLPVTRYSMHEFNKCHTMPNTMDKWANNSTFTKSLNNNYHNCFPLYSYNDSGSTSTQTSESGTESETSSYYCEVNEFDYEDNIDCVPIGSYSDHRFV